MYLVRSTAEYVVAGRPKPGFPILLWDDMNSCGEANEFLRYYLGRGAIGSKKSWGTTAQAIYDFFGFLEAHELVWNEVDRAEAKDLVGAYRDFCFETMGHKRSTVRNRLTYVIAFYKFAVRRAWINHLPYEYEQRFAARSEAFLAHADGSRGAVEVASPMPRARKKDVDFLTRDQAAKLLSAAINPHHKMIIRLALRSGLRREELASFPSNYVFDPDAGEQGSGNIRLRLDPADGSGMKTKGDKPRTIYITRHLMSELNHYRVHWRGERASLVDQEQRAFFLNQDGLPWAADGKGMGGDGAVDRQEGRNSYAPAHAAPHLRHAYLGHLADKSEAQWHRAPSLPAASAWTLQCRDDDDLSAPCQRAR